MPGQTQNLSSRLKTKGSQVHQHMPVTPALGRRGQEDLSLDKLKNSKASQRTCPFSDPKNVEKHLIMRLVAKATKSVRN